jgi:hypothetical protein
MLAVAGVAAMGPANKSFEEQFNIPGKEAFAANSQIAATHGNGGDVAPLVPVVPLPEGQTVDSPRPASGPEGRVEPRSVPARYLAYAAYSKDRLELDEVAEAHQKESQVYLFCNS